MTSLTKEVCLICTKYIATGQFIVECCECDGAMHHKCFKKSNLSTLSEDFYCTNCSHLAAFRYNPFRLDIETEENTDVDDIIVKVDQILKTVTLMTQIVLIKHTLNNCMITCQFSSRT